MSFLQRLFTPDVEKLKARGDVKGLIKALRYERDCELRRVSARALGRIGDARAVQPLLAALKDEDKDMREAAHDAIAQLAETGGARVVEPLIVALKDTDWMVRLNAAEALGKIGDAQATKPLITALEDTMSYVRMGAAEALGRIGDAQATKPLITALERRYYVSGIPDVTYLSVRVSAAEALGKLGDARAVKPLIAALTDIEVCLRRKAAEALGKLGDAQAVKPLITALEDEDEDVRQAAQAAIGQLAEIGGARVVEPLIAALQDTDSKVRLDAAEALGKIGDTQATKPLIAILRDAKDVLQGRVAAQALDKLGWQPNRGAAGAAYWVAKGEWSKCVKMGPPAVKRLITALEDTDWSVRLSAIKALAKMRDKRAVKPLIRTMAKAESGKRSFPYTGEELLEIYMDDDSPGHSTYHALFREFREEDEENVKLAEASDAAVRALRSITGKRFGKNAARWEQWLKEQR